MNSLYRWRYTGVWIDNRLVAAGLNIAIAYLAGGIGTAALRAFIKKVGTKTAIYIIERAVKNKLIWFGLKQVSGITPVINTIVKNLMNPGAAVARWYDSHDKRPRNGHCDIL